MSCFHGGEGAGFAGADFSSNTCPLGSHTAVRGVFESLAKNIDELALYPDREGAILKKALAEFWGFHGGILLGGGAADLIQLTACVLGNFRSPQKGKKAGNIIVEPAFSEYENALKIVCSNEQIIHLTLSESNGFSFASEDLAFLKAVLLSRAISLVFIASPSNPAGVVIDFMTLREIVSLCEAHGAITVIDACFCQFSSEAENCVRQMIKKAGEFQNVILLNAFTKIYGMAALRSGYALCFNRMIYERLCRRSRPWAMSLEAQMASAAVIKSEEASGKSWQNRVKSLVQEEKAVLVDYLSSLGAGVSFIKGEANFILFKLSGELQAAAELFSRSRGDFKSFEDNSIDTHGSKKDYKERPDLSPLCRALLKKRVLIRGCADFRGLDESWYRCAVKTRQENKLLIEALKDIFKDISNERSRSK